MSYEKKAMTARYVEKLGRAGLLAAAALLVEHCKDECYPGVDGERILDPRVLVRAMLETDEDLAVHFFSLLLKQEIEEPVL